MKKSIFAVLLLVASLFAASAPARAAEVYSGPMTGFMMSPMTQRLTLKPGETYTGSFYLMNPEQNTIPVTYTLKIQGFYRDENNNAIFEDVEGRSQIANWITLRSPETNTLAPSVSDKVFYTITVPDSPPAGGQYAAITATSSPTSDNAIIAESVAMNYTIFAEIEGETARSSEITDIKLPSFFLDGNITASSRVKNTGNVHGTATYTMVVTPVFSNTPAYTNEDAPLKKLILPDRAMEQEVTWDNTPSIGIFNVYYKIEFEGGDIKEVTKLVIKCPIWLLLVIVLGLTGFILAIVKHFKSKKKKTPSNVEGA